MEGCGKLWVGVQPCGELLRIAGVVEGCRGLWVFTLPGQVDDTIVSGKVYGVLNFYSLETGRLLEKEVLTSPYVDGSISYDWGNNLIWYASNTVQALCWLKSIYATPVHHMEGQPLQPEVILASDTFAMPDDPAAELAMELVGVRVLASCDLLSRSYMPHTDTLYLYKDMYLVCVCGPVHCIAHSGAPPPPPRQLQGP